MADITVGGSRIYPIATFIEDLCVNFTSTPREPRPKSISARRLIIIGDVHGSRKTLEALLAQVDFDRSMGDEVIFVGDLVNKGPDSGGVIDLAIKLGARCVRGNHDDAVLRASEGLKTGGSGDASSQEDKSGSRATAEKLSPGQLEYLASLPLIIRMELTPSLPGIKHVVVVHAGLVPRMVLEEQPRRDVMHMRSLSLGMPMEEDGERGWIESWDEWQEEEQEKEKTMVVFGHDARRRLQTGRYALGLDSGCVYGGKLSAWVIGAEGAEGIVQVDYADGG